MASTLSYVTARIHEAIRHFQAGNLPGAERLLKKVLKEQPRNVDALHIMGVIHGVQSKHSQARDCLVKAVRLDPTNSSIQFNLAKSLSELGRDHESLPHHARATHLAPANPEAWLNYGKSLGRLGREKEALDCYEKALAINPNYAEALNNKGLLLKDLDRSEESLVSFEKALAIKPDLAEAWLNRGNALRKLERFEEALACDDQAVRLKPEAIAWFNRGFTLNRLGRRDEALENFDRAIALHPAYAEAFSNRGVVRAELKQYAAALADYEQALSLKPDHAEAQYNRGIALERMKRLDAAVESYDRAIALRPDYADASWNKALALLLMGNFERAWELYEWRWNRTAVTQRRMQLAREWKGEKMDGSLLVLPEQGLGDEIFYSGMLNDLKGFAGSITVAVDPRLVAIYERSFDHLVVVSLESVESAPPFDAQVYMATLGCYFRSSGKALENVKVPYLRADPDRAAGLREKLRTSGRILCGLSWDSRNRETGRHKSLALKDLHALLRIPNVEFVNLQYGDTSAEQAALAAATGIKLTNVDEVDNFNDMDGLAALIAACDIVITVSSTTAHLAAALGARVLVMLPYSAGLIWYWHDGREDSPWYPSATLFRQDETAEWGGVVEKVALALHRFAESGS